MAMPGSTSRLRTTAAGTLRYSSRGRMARTRRPCATEPAARRAWWRSPTSTTMALPTSPSRTSWRTRSRSCTATATARSRRRSCTTCSSILWGSPLPTSTATAARTSRSRRWRTMRFRCCFAVSAPAIRRRSRSSRATARVRACRRRSPSTLAVRVLDAAGNPVVGTSVSFSAPASGASATFAGAQVARGFTDALGVATAPAATANGIAGAYGVTVAAGAASATFALANTGVSPGITSAPPPGGAVDVAYTHAVDVTGTPRPSVSASPGALPPGLVLNPSTGLISGTPSRAGTFAGMLTAGNGVPPDATQAFAIAIAAAGQAIAFGVLPDRSVDSLPFALSAAASSGLPVSFASLASTVCRVDGVQVTLIAAGSCTIRASQAGDAIVCSRNAGRSHVCRHAQRRERAPDRDARRAECGHAIRRARDHHARGASLGPGWRHREGRVLCGHGAARHRDVAAVSLHLVRGARRNVRAAGRRHRQSRRAIRLGRGECVGDCFRGRRSR